MRGLRSLKITVVSGRYRVNNLDPSLFPCHGIAQDFALRPQFLAFPKQAGGSAKRLKLVPPPGTTFASNDASLRCFSGPGALVTSTPLPRQEPFQAPLFQCEDKDM